MASKARFGRLPRSAPSLTSTIVALAQQYQNQRDANIESAWKSGGQFEGKKVTDSEFIDHWKERMSSVSQDDPMWDYYNNKVYQYQFTIAESKMGEKYAEGSASDGQMASFYREWAKKMPVDSENYRQLMTQAAKFKAAATARGNSRASSTATAAYNAAQQNTYNKHEAPYDVTIQELTKYAVSAGYLHPADVIDTNTGKVKPDYGWGKLTNATGENDPANFANLLDDIMNDKGAKDAITAKIRAAGDTNFSGQFNEETIAGMANNARNGATIRLNRAIKAKDKSGVTAARTSLNTDAKASMVIRALLGVNGAKNGFIEQDAAHRKIMDDVIAPDSGASPLERHAAIQAYQSWLTGDGAQTLAQVFPPGADDPKSPNFDIYAAGLYGSIRNTINSLNGQSTGLTLKDDPLGFEDGHAGADSDAVKLATTVGGLTGKLADVASGASIIVKTDASGKPDVNGTTWSILDKNSTKMQNVDVVPFATPAYGALTLPNGTVLGGDQGEVQYQPTQPIKISVTPNVDPNSNLPAGSPLKPVPTQSDVVGSRIEVAGPNGVMTPVYGVYQGGQRVWTYTDPFSSADRGSSGTDAHGDYIISYAHPGGVAAGAPAPPFSPSAYINTAILKQPIADPKVPGRLVDSSDGSTWDPTQDKQTVWGSPMSAYAHSSSAALAHVAGMGQNAIVNVEKQWYSDPNNWTPTMKAQAQAGVSPDNIVAGASQDLYQTVAAAQRYGYLPEAQQPNRISEAYYRTARAAASQGLTVGEYQGIAAADSANARRGDIAAQLEKWGTATAPNQQVITGGGQVTTRAQAAWGSKGWNITDLLNQPGMSDQQANDLAYQISHGAVGTPLAPTTYTHTNPGRDTRQITSPTANPYLPNGVLPTQNPAQTPPSAGPVIKPKAVVPASTAPPGKGVDPISGVVVDLTAPVAPPKGVNPGTWGGGPGASGV